MAEHQASCDPLAGDWTQRRSGLWFTLLVVAMAWLIGVLFATGFWNTEANNRESSLDVNVSAVGGLLPKVVVTSKEIIVATRRAAVEAPTTGLK